MVPISYRCMIRKRLALLCHLILFVYYAKLTYACCLDDNPSFPTSPIVTNISPTIVRIDWKSSVNRWSCVDRFDVYYWRSDFEIRQDEPQFTQNNKYNQAIGYEEINVLENTFYTFKINAREEQTRRCGASNNWSSDVTILTLKSSTYFYFLRDDKNWCVLLLT